jgi:hypothetical protein
MGIGVGTQCFNAAFGLRRDWNLPLVSIPTRGHQSGILWPTGSSLRQLLCSETDRSPHVLQSMRRVLPSSRTQDCMVYQAS